MLHDKIDVLGNTLHKRTVDNADTLSIGDNGTGEHNRSEHGGTLQNRKHRSRRNYISAQKRNRRKPKRT
jgi:hypothetical protein